MSANLQPGSYRAFAEATEGVPDAELDRRCKYCLTVGDHYCPNDLCRPGLDDLTEDELKDLMESQ